MRSASNQVTTANGVRCVRIGDLRATVAAQLVADAVEHQHFAVETVERAQAKIAVPQQLPDRDIAVVDAVEQSRPSSRSGRSRCRGDARASRAPNRADGSLRTRPDQRPR